MTPKELRNLRKAAGLTQEKLAGICGVERRTIGRWEKGYFPIPKMVLDCLERVLGPYRDKAGVKVAVLVLASLLYVAAVASGYTLTRSSWFVSLEDFYGEH